MNTEVFDSSSNDNAVAEFQSWLDANPTGFYINMKTRSQGMLHIVGCYHLGNPREWPEGAADPCRNPKVCDTDRQELIRWAQNADIKVEQCGHCAA